MRSQGSCSRQLQRLQCHLPPQLQVVGQPYLAKRAFTQETTNAELSGERIGHAWPLPGRRVIHRSLIVPLLGQAAARLWRRTLGWPAQSLVRSEARVLPNTGRTLVKQTHGADQFLVAFHEFG